MYDDLLALAHVDVVDDRWRVTPPLLSVLADGGGNGVLVGSRATWLVDALADLDAHEDEGLRLLADHVYENSFVPQPGPSTWYFAAGPEAPLAALGTLGITVLQDAAGSLLSQTVARGPELVGRTVRPGELVGRMTLSGPFSTSQVVWEPVTGDQQVGFYCYMRNRRRVYAERTPTGWLEMDFRWGVWRGAPRQAPCLWFVPRERRLLLASTVRPPLEVERALVLRTGRLPQRASVPEVTGGAAPVAAYLNVSHSVASTSRTSSTRN